MAVRYALVNIFCHHKVALLGNRIIKTIKKVIPQYFTCSCKNFIYLVIFLTFMPFCLMRALLVEAECFSPTFYEYLTKP